MSKKNKEDLPYAQIRDLLKKNNDTKYFNQFVIDNNDLKYQVGWFDNYYDEENELLYEDEMFEICFNEIGWEELKDFISVEKDHISNYTRIKIERLVIGYGK